MVVGLEGQAGQSPCHTPSICQAEHCVSQPLILGYRPERKTDFLLGFLGTVTYS